MKKGFTLIELLVSVALMTFLLVVLSGSAVAFLNLWQRGIAHGERRQTAFYAFGRITRDLHLATPTLNPAYKPIFTINPTSIGAKYQNPQALFFEGNDYLTGYFVQWVNKVPILCRLRTNHGNIINDDLIINNAPANKISEYEGLLAENVLGIWFQPMDAKNEPIRTQEGAWNAANGYNALLDDWRIIWAPPDPEHPEWWIKKIINEGPHNYSLMMPAYIKVTIVTVDAQTAKKLNGTGTEIPPKPLNDDVTKDAEMFFENLPEPIRRGSSIYSTSVLILAQR
jgi:prepilin-type N-terminal cleavage/methylation domain-containing protein